MLSPYERQPGRKGLPGRRGLECLLQGSPISSKTCPSRFGCSEESRLDLVSPSKVAVYRKQLQPISLCVKMVENIEEMGNLEGTILLLKEKCEVLLLNKILLKKK